MPGEPLAILKVMATRHQRVPGSFRVQSVLRDSDLESRLARLRCGFAALNNPRDVVGDAIPQSRRDVVPHSLDQDEFCTGDCRGGCATTTDIAHGVVGAMDDKCRNVEGLEESCAVA